MLVKTWRFIAILLASLSMGMAFCHLMAICLAVAHAAWWIWVAPVNAALVPLSLDTLRTNWTELRNQWEFTHAARAVLQILEVCALVLSLLVEIPERV